jgi:hypothetical protein
MLGIPRVKLKAGPQQGIGNRVAQMTERRARKWAVRYDSEVDVFRHPPDQTVRAA